MSVWCPYQLVPVFVLLVVVLEVEQKLLEFACSTCREELSRESRADKPVQLMSDLAAYPGRSHSLGEP